MRACGRSLGFSQVAFLLCQGHQPAVILRRRCHFSPKSLCWRHLMPTPPLLSNRCAKNMQAPKQPAASRRQCFQKTVRPVLPEPMALRRHHLAPRPCQGTMTRRQTCTPQSSTSCPRPGASTRTMIARGFGLRHLPSSVLLGPSSSCRDWGSASFAGRASSHDQVVLV